MAVYGYTKDGFAIRTQFAMVLYVVQSEPGRTITQWECIKEFGFTRLSGIVKKIEARYGIVLNRRDVTVQNRYGGMSSIREYWFDPAVPTVQPTDIPKPRKRKAPAVEAKNKK